MQRHLEETSQAQVGESRWHRPQERAQAAIRLQGQQEHRQVRGWRLERLLQRGWSHRLAQSRCDRRAWQRHWRVGHFLDWHADRDETGCCSRHRGHFLQNHRQRRARSWIAQEGRGKGNWCTACTVAAAKAAVGKRPGMAARRVLVGRQLLAMALINPKTVQASKQYWAKTFL